MNNIAFDFKTKNNIAFGKLYKNNFGKISSFVQNNRGNNADAEDLFQDAMMVIIEKLRQDNFQLTASVDTYVYAICKNLWFKKLRDKNHELSVNELKSIDFLTSISHSIEDEKTYSEKLKAYLVKITSHCNRLIQDMFFKEKTIDQIQKDYGYSTRHNAQNQKHKCIQQIRKVKEQDDKIKKNTSLG